LCTGTVPGLSCTSTATLIVIFVDSLLRLGTPELLFGGKATPAGYGRVELTGQRPVGFALFPEFETAPRESVRREARRYATSCQLARSKAVRR
jgi:hypothetical protein